MTQAGGKPVSIFGDFVEPRHLDGHRSSGDTAELLCLAIGVVRNLDGALNQAVGQCLQAAGEGAKAFIQCSCSG